jgi:hypothetical protein
MPRDPASELLSDAFWSGAFDPLDPHRHAHEFEFRRGLLDPREQDLAWARLAIYALQECAVLPSWRG